MQKRNYDVCEQKQVWKSVVSRMTEIDGWTVGYTKEEYDNAMAVATVQVIRKAFEEPHEDCRIKSFQDWITSRAKQLHHKAEREEIGLHSELCDHCAYIEHLLTALVEQW